MTLWKLTLKMIISTHVVDKDVLYYLTFLFQVCDLNPQKTCKFQTKLVPKLKPAHECTIIPREVCNLKFTSPQEVEKPLKTKWCLDPTPAAPGESYDESEAAAEPLSASESQADSVLLPAYGAPAQYGGF